MGQAARGAIQETVASLASALFTGLNTSSHTLHSPSSTSLQAQSHSNHTSDPEDSDSDETAIEEMKRQRVAQREKYKAAKGQNAALREVVSVTRNETILHVEAHSVTL